MLQPSRQPHHGGAQGVDRGDVLGGVRTEAARRGPLGRGGSRGNSGTRGSPAGRGVACARARGKVGHVL
ncbi:hypothetical protein SLNWT_4264 [Streptomyces albus]|uniref:Uncharacterized protein n=1 Tax=Streptomyces albus (strain ATCC 21838 / DSM 41398 / FERM P-419 / JCM 4703 / NBRC 107858) TaxID=1081613 RepID=A0A0B5EZ26_STRA4|nr:hypothetical protein SLNWT_4264 [Streptomyces albus]AOU78948.1 hypothetical protein SLNHY_4257 [Streptomyces albus]AYN34681.1 hypothetical protein DUI70_4184 [Streptomyces albus]